MRIGLALGGGGARGFAHLGVLKVLEQQGFKVDIVAGTSMGAVIGALYAIAQRAKEAEKTARSFNQASIVKELEERFSPHALDKQGRLAPFKKTISFLRDAYFWNLKAVKKWLIDYKPFEALFKEVFGQRDFSSCRLPFVCTAVDIKAGEEIELDSGLLYEALLASSALPGVFPPLRWQGKILVDGGVLAPIPTQALRKRKADFILAVSLENRNLHPNVSNSTGMLMSVDEIRHLKIVESCLKMADFVIEPEVRDYSWADFSRIDEIIAQGQIAAEKILKPLRQALRRKKLFFWQKWNLFCR